MKKALLCFIVAIWGTLGYGQESGVYLSGTFQLSAGLNSIDGIAPRRPADVYSLSGNPTLHFGEISIPFHFILSNYQRDFRQPFNQFGLSPRFKGITFHLGHRAVSWSRYTLGGHRFFGLGVEAQLGKLRLGAVRGRFLEAVARDTSVQARGIRPTYARRGTALKLGFGSETSYVDLLYFRATDDESSLPATTFNAGIKPTQNAVLGVKANILLAKKITFLLDAGFSGLTRDTRAPRLETDSSAIYRFAERFLEPRLSSQLNFAGEAGVSWRTDNFRADLKYRQVDPGYTTQGSYYLRTDLVQTTLGGFVSLAKSKIALTGRLGLEHDNLREQKSRTTKRVIFNSGLNLRPSPFFNFNAQWSNFGISQEGAQVSVSDTTRLDNITSSLILNPNFNLVAGKNNHNFNLVYSDQALNDNNRFTAQYTSITSRTINGNYSLSLGAQALTANAGINFTRAEIFAGNTSSRGFSLGLSKQFSKQRIVLNASYYHNSNAFEETANGSTKRLALTANWSSGKNHQLRFNFYRMKNESLNSQVSRSFTELHSRLTYAYRFTTRKPKS